MTHLFTGKSFAASQICICVCAAAAYAGARDWRHAIYWTAAAVLTAAVTF